MLLCLGPRGPKGGPMHLGAVSVFLAAFSGAVALASQPETPAQDPSRAPANPVKAKFVRASRQDLATAYLRLERTLSRVTMTPEQTVDVNRRFDQASIAFFSGQYAGAVRTLSEIVREREGLEMTAGLAVAECMQVKPSHAVVHPGNKDGARLMVEPMFAPGGSWSESSVDVAIVLLDARREPAWTRVVSVPLVSGAPQPAQIDAAACFADWPRGDFTIAIRAGSALIEKCRLTVADRSMDEARQALIGRLAGVLPDASAEVVRAAAIAKARAECLGDDFDAKSSRRFLAEQSKLAAQVAGEIDIVRAGKNPYQRVAGDQWRPVGGVPCRVYVPQSVLDRLKPAPLLVAFHGAGGDESMFFEGYGAGAIKTLADRHGFVVVCPQTERATAASAFDKVLDDIAVDFPLDVKRIYVLGHSMGAAATASLASARGARIAAACCIAGSAWGSTSSTGRRAPTLTIAAELDPLFGVGRARKAAESIKPPDEFLEVKGYGHTLVVGSQLARAVDWLLARSLE